MSWQSRWLLRAMGMTMAAGLLASCAQPLDEAQLALREADRAMGGTTLKTLAYSATGAGASFGQAYQPGMAWPRIKVTAFERQIDYENAALREEATRTRAEPTGGSALPLMGMGEQRTTVFVRGPSAWNQAAAGASAAPSAVDARIHDLWTTPHGVLKAAMRNTAHLRREGDRRVIDFSEPGRFTASVWISPDGLVERVDSMLPNPVMGDTASTILFSGYREAGGIRFPAHIEQHVGGFMVLDLQVTQVQPNAPVSIELPPSVASFTEQVAVEKAADGVWFLGGGSHNSVLVEMKDHLVLVESPLYDGRAQAVLAQAHALVPGKPVRYVVNSHHHFDHSGGLRAAAAAGATLVVSEQARPWFERVLAHANTINPDALARAGGKFTLLGVNGQRTFNDGSREIDIFMIEDSIHSQGFMMVWLPKERLLIEADAYTPGPPGAAPPAQANANNVNLLQNMERLRIDAQRILPLHGRMVPVTDLRAAVAAPQR